MDEVTTRDRIILAAVECLARLGWERTTITEVAKRAGVTRPTLYAYFPTKDDLFAEVGGRAAEEISERIVRHAAAEAPTGAEFVVEVVVAAVREFRADPSASLIGLVRPGEALGPDAVAVTRAFLDPLLEREPGLAGEMDEIAETLMRFVVSFLVTESPPPRSDEELRAYLVRRLVPALGLRPPPLQN
ncbi:MAG TPA: TetR/AcrR family transcriptional regulator [Acidimicrobiales bacterium]|nr:TetR/AcrR family transcriptional regulator [Acidimicrobiales bacterium]